MIKPLIITLSLLISFNCFAYTDTILTLDMENRPILPAQFRYATPSRANVSASASGQFSEKSLLEILKLYSSSKVIIIDLREEAHSFINGIAVSWRAENNWGNKDKTIQEADKSLFHEMNELFFRKEVDLFSKSGLKECVLKVKDMHTEKEIVESLGAIYVHLPVTDHIKPSNLIVDQFILLIRALTPDNFIHFHCRGGKGRSTTFLTMYDMLYSASEDTFEEILLRQKNLGGADFLAPLDDVLWKYPYLMERKKFLESFYRYCQEADFKKTLWTEWQAFSVA